MKIQIQEVLNKLNMLQLIIYMFSTFLPPINKYIYTNTTNTMKS